MRSKTEDKQENLLNSIWLVSLLLFVSVLVWVLFKQIGFIEISISIDELSFLVLFVTAVVVAWYTNETKKLREISEETFRETQKQSQYERTPYLCLRWKSKISIQGELRSLLGPYGVGGVLRTFTGIEIVNVGRGMAKDIQFKKCVRFSGSGDSEEDINLSYISVLSADGGIEQIKHGSLSLYETEVGKLDEPSSFYISIQIEYKDVIGDCYIAEFMSHKEASNGFAEILQIHKDE